MTNSGALKTSVNVMLSLLYIIVVFKIITVFVSYLKHMRHQVQCN